MSHVCTRYKRLRVALGELQGQNLKSTQIKARGTRLNYSRD